MVQVDSQALVSLLLQRLEPETERLAIAFSSSVADVGVRYCYIDQLLPEDIARQIDAAFPSTENMRLMDSFRERKFTSKNYDEFNPILKAITFAIQDPKVVRVIEQITGIHHQIPDPALYAGGLSSMTKGNFLGPHLDNSHDGLRKYYRTLNLLYYVTPDWKLEFGGNLELWDKKVLKSSTIVSNFNRLVIMETTPVSWHSVSEVKVDKIRKCVSNYYFSPISPTGYNYFNVTSFSARPEQTFRRVLAHLDNRLRQAMRKIAPYGLGKKDVYNGSKD